MKEKQREFNFKENKKTDCEVFSEWYREWRNKQDEKLKRDKVKQITSNNPQ